MPRHQLTRDERARGGRAVAAKQPPPECPRCSRSMAGHSWHSYLGHLRRHQFAERHFNGDLAAAHRYLVARGLAAQDPAPWNGAWRDPGPLPKIPF